MIQINNEYRMTKIDIKHCKIIVSVRSELIDLVDVYVNDHRTENINRSAVIEDALRIWVRQAQEKEDELYFQKNAAKLNADS